MARGKGIPVFPQPSRDRYDPENEAEFRRMIIEALSDLGSAITNAGDDVARPQGWPEYVGATPGGAFADIEVLHHNHRGDETLEVWIQEPGDPGGGGGSGVVEEPAPGVKRGYTDFSEFDEGVGVPTGMTLHDNGRNAASFCSIQTDDDEGRFVQIHRSAFPWHGIALAIDSLHGAFAGEGEILARLYKNSTGTNSIRGGPAWSIGEGNNVDVWFGVRHYRPSSGDYRWDGYVLQDAPGGTSAGLWSPNRQSSAVPVGYVGWFWMRIRLEQVDLGNGLIGYRHWVRWWTGDVDDEPETWNVVDDVNSGDLAGTNPSFLQALGFGVQQPPSSDQATRVAILSFTTDPEYPPLTEPVAPTPGTDPIWVKAGDFAVTPGAEQTIRIENLDLGVTYPVALRYRRNAKYNQGAAGPDPEAWQPEQCRGQFTNTSVAASIKSAVWSRTASDAERITVTVTPAEDLEAYDISLYRSVAGDDDYSLVHTQEGPHAGDVEFVDASITGETLYDYYVVTETDTPSDPSDTVRVWAGPAGTPTFESAAPLGAGYRVLFENGLSGAAVELHDSYDDNGGIGAHSLRATSSVDATHVDSGTLTNVPSPGLTFLAQLRYKLTQFTVDDYGQFGPSFNVTVPNSE